MKKGNIKDNKKILDQDQKVEIIRKKEIIAEVKVEVDQLENNNEKNEIYNLFI